VTLNVPTPSIPRNTRLYIAGLAVVLIAFTTASSAQDPTVRFWATDYRHELSATYTRVQTDGSFGHPVGLNGWTASFAEKLLPAAQVVGEVGQYRRNNISVKSFLGGPQMKLNIWRVQPFVRALGGLTRVNAFNEFTLAGGGGVDVPVTSHFKVRALQCDYYRLLGGTFHGADYLRLGFGVTYGFGD
jgi:hypothetical protein